MTDCKKTTAHKHVASLRQTMSLSLVEMGGHFLLNMKLFDLLLCPGLRFRDFFAVLSSPGKIVGAMITRSD